MMLCSSIFFVSRPQTFVQVICQPWTVAVLLHHQVLNLQNLKNWGRYSHPTKEKCSLKQKQNIKKQNKKQNKQKKLCFTGIPQIWIKGPEP